MIHLDARIGLLNSGRAYAFIDGYAAAAFSGTVAEVAAALARRDAGDLSPIAPAPVAAPAKPARAAKARRTFRALVTCPNGHREEYDAEAYTKAEARALIGDYYRDENPLSGGCYSFSSCDFAWIAEAI